MWCFFLNSDDKATAEHTDVVLRVVQFRLRAFLRKRFLVMRDTTFRMLVAFSILALHVACSVTSFIPHVHKVRFHIKPFCRYRQT